MQLAICTDVFADLTYIKMLDKVKALGIDAVEMTAGGWGAQKHCNTKELLANAGKREAFMAELEKRGMRISALNTSCNPLWPSKTGRQYAKSMYDCAELAGKLGVKKLICMAGLPAGNETDTTPNWIVSTISWPDFMAPAYEYQWQVTIAFWQEFAAHCKKCGVEQIAIEEFPGTMVWNVETMLKLREATDSIIGINLDPSHLMVLGADPIASARALEECIFHVHGKDARIEQGVAGVNGLFEPKPVTETKNRSWNYVALAAARICSGGKNSFQFSAWLGIMAMYPWRWRI